MPADHSDQTGLAGVASNLHRAFWDYSLGAGNSHPHSSHYYYLYQLNATDSAAACMDLITTFMGLWFMRGLCSAPVLIL